MSIKIDGMVRVAAATPHVKVADCPYNKNEMAKMIREAAANGASVIAVMPVPDDQVNRFGVIAGSAISDDVWKIDSLVEKPALEDAPSNLAVFGRYLLSPRVMELLAEVKPGVGGEIQLTDALRVMSHREPLYAYRFSGRRYDVGNKQGYLQAMVEYALRRDDLKDEFASYLKNIVKGL